MPFKVIGSVLFSAVNTQKYWNSIKNNELLSFQVQPQGGRQVKLINKKPEQTVYMWLTLAVVACVMPFKALLEKKQQFLDSICFIVLKMPGCSTNHLHPEMVWEATAGPPGWGGPTAHPDVTLSYQATCKEFSL